jgi:hypothetical protein
MKTRLTAVSFGLAVAAAVFLFVVPVYSVFTGDQHTHLTLFEVTGVRTLIPVIFPVAVAFVPLVLRKQVVRISAAVIMCGFTFISGFSIGLYYLPAAIMMLLAACVADSARLRDAVL